jgi:hypothetical protein
MIKMQRNLKNLRIYTALIIAHKEIANFKLVVQLELRRLLSILEIFLRFQIESRKLSNVNRLINQMKIKNRRGNYLININEC